MVATAAVVVIVLGIVGWFYYAVDPSSGLMPRCAFKHITSYDCPGCGVQRALHALLHGDIATAWHYNAFIFFAIPVAIFYSIAEILRHRYPRLHNNINRPVVLIIITLAIIIWWIGRNI